MGSIGRIAIGARGQLSYAEEWQWGTPVAPTQRIDFVTESFNNEIGALQSAQLDPSRAVVAQVQGTSNISGDVAFELNTEGYETLYKHALGDAITIDSTDGGIRTQLTSAASATTLSVESTTGFNSPTGQLTLVYKDSNGLLQQELGAYTGTTATTFTGVTGITLANLAVGRWIFQSDTTNWIAPNPVYTHYIEAARDLPQGLTFEVGRDVAFFVYDGVKTNTLENTYNSGEILTGTFGYIGRQEYIGALLAADPGIGGGSLSLSDYVESSRDPLYVYTVGDPGGTPVWTDETADAINDTDDDVFVFPDIATPAAVDDAFYVGSANKFRSVGLKITTAGSASWTIAWEYWDGAAWSALTFVQQDVSDFSEGPDTLINGFEIPSDWATTTVNSASAYWIRARISAYTSQTTRPILGRVWVDLGLVGFNFTGTVQVGSENGITYTGLDVDPQAETASITGLQTSGDYSLEYAHAIGEPVVGQVSWDSPADPPGVDPLSSFQAAFYIDGTAQEVLSGSWTLNNNLFGDKFQLGSKYRAGLPEQQRAVEGTINVEFDDLLLYRRFYDGTAARVEFRCVDETSELNATGPVYRQFHAILPNIKYTGTTPQIGGPDQIVHDMPFTALRDSTNDMNEVACIFVNGTDHNF